MKQQFPRPKILVSRCLGFAACRYDGQQLRSRIIDLLREHVDFVAVCPEVEAGLGFHAPPSVSVRKKIAWRYGSRPMPEP